MNRKKIELQSELEERSMPLNQGEINPEGLPAPYGSLQDRRAEDITTLHTLPVVPSVTVTERDILDEYLDVRPSSETPRFEPHKQVFTYTVNVTVDSSVDIPFKAQSFRIDNLCNQWLFLTQFRRYIPPYWFGAVFSGTGLSSLSCIWQAPGGMTQPVVKAGEQAIISAHLERLVPIDGESLTGVSGSPSFGQQVQGVVADGAAAAGVNPVLVAGFDGVNVQTLLTTTTGILSMGNAAVPSDVGTTIIQQIDQALIPKIGASLQYAKGSLGLLPTIRTPDRFTTFSLALAAAETTIWTPAAGRKFRFMGGVITASVATVLTFRDNTAGTLIFTVSLNAGVPWNMVDMGNGILSAVANNVLTVTRSVASALDGTLYGTEE